MVVLPLVVKPRPIKNIAQLPHLGGSALSWAVLSWGLGRLLQSAMCALMLWALKTTKP